MIAKRYIFPLLVLMTFLANSMPGWWDWGYAYGTRRWYYIMQAACWFPMLLSLEFYDKTDRIHKNVMFIFLSCLINNLADELFFDPIHIGINELVFSAFMLLWIFWLLTPKKNG